MSAPRGACRFCGAGLERTFCDLGLSPLSNAFIEPSELARPELFYPLRAWVCSKCLLVQLEQFEPPERIFSDDYAYFSSYSDSWLQHCERYVTAAVQRFGIGPASRVVEIASNDGYLLQYFKRRGVPVLGIEPAANVAQAARDKGIPTESAFFGTQYARRLVAEGRQADLAIANNVLAHVPDVNDFVAGLGLLLAPDGAATLEFPHLLRLVLDNQFDTIYHEHFSYFSLLVTQRLFAAHQLRVFAVEELPTHGGSLRLYVDHGTRPVQPSVNAVLAAERDAGLDRLERYEAFAEQVRASKRSLLEFLLRAKGAGRRIAAYGAAAKGNTLLNYCGVRSDFIDFVADRSPRKQGRFLPGTRIPVVAPERIAEARPDYLLILPWNLREEIMTQNTHIRAWGGRFVVPIPQVQIL